MKEQDIDKLFEAARNEPPHISFENAKRVFTEGLGVKAEISFWKQLLTLKNGLIMLGIGGIIMLAVFGLQPNTDAETSYSNEEHGNQQFKMPLISDVIEDNMIRHEDQKRKDSIEISSDKYILLEGEGLDIVKIDIEEPKQAEEVIQNEKQISFKISNRTVEEKIRTIQKLADKAGIDLMYRMEGEPSTIREISLMIRDDEEKRYKVKFSNNFELNIGWFQNENGKAFKLYNDISNNVFKDLLNKQEEIEEEPKSIEAELKVDEIEAEIKNSNYEGKLIKESFTITNLTTEADIQVIQQKAISAGIDFIYRGRFKKEKIKFLNISMYINDGGEKRIKNSLHIHGSNKSSYSYILSWRTDEKGKAVDFDGKEDRSRSN